MGDFYSGPPPNSLAKQLACKEQSPCIDTHRQTPEVAKMQSWDERIAAFLSELSSIQEECLRILKQKQRAVARWDLEALSAVQDSESVVLRKLEDCQRRRAELLKEAADTGHSAQTIRELIRQLPASELSPGRRRQLEIEAEKGSWHWQLLQHQALANWLLLQRTLLHLSQMLEIIATGGQTVPTYSIRANSEESASSKTGGILIDQAI